MEAPTIRKILGLGWTYCPWCGVTLVIAPSMPTPEIMVWSEQLNGEETMREVAHLQTQANRWVKAHRDDLPPVTPRRLRLFNGLVWPLAWLLGYKVIALKDKRYKEGIDG